MRSRAWLGPVLVLFLAGCAPAQLDMGGRAPRTLHLLAASSLINVLTAVGPSLEQRLGFQLRVSYGASSEAATWLRQGAAADLVLVADPSIAFNLEREQRIDALRPLWSNRLVLVRSLRSRISPNVTPASSSQHLPASDLQAHDPRLHAVQRLAMGEPATVPAGHFAAEALRYLGCWDELRPRVVYARDARLALRWVTEGAADGGLVYSTDAQASGNEILVVANVPEAAHAPIRYVGGCIRSSPHHAAAQAALDFLATPPAQAPAKALGFGPP